MKLEKGIKNNSGRNNRGIITSKHRGGGNKIKYKKVNLGSSLLGVVGKVVEIKRDAKRGAFIHLVACSNGYMYYGLSTHGLKIGSYIMSTREGYLYDGVSKLGSQMELGRIEEGGYVHSIEKYPGSGAVYARGAGCFGKIISHNKKEEKVLVELSSGQVRSFGINNKAVYGVVSNIELKDYVYYKAGQVRWQNKRPTVRGVAMNPVDHPHGGGEGKTSGGRHPVTPWGRLTKGVKTGKVKLKGYQKISRKNR